MLKSERITEEILSYIRSELNTFISGLIDDGAAEETIDLEATEIHLRDFSQNICRLLIQKVCDSCFSGYQGVAIECECGGWQRFVNKRSRKVRTLFGNVEVPHWYYGCSDCGRTSSFQSPRLGDGNESCSFALRRVMSILGSETTYRAASELLRELTGQDVSVSQFERVAGAVGAHFEASEEHEVSRSLKGCRDTSIESPDDIYVCVDGAMVREDEEWRECKVATVFDAIVNEEGEPEQGKASYQAGVWASDELGRRMYHEARRRGLERAGRLVVLGDGARWIWRQSDLHFGDPIEIIDWYHACEHLWEVSREFYGDETERCRRWVDSQKGFLMTDRVEVVIHNIEKLTPRTKRQTDIRRTNLGYFGDNRERMRYGTFRKQGMFIGSGAVESACKHVVQQRFKGAGMRWKKEGLKHLMAIRLARKSNRFEQAWKQYKKQTKKAA